MAYYSSTLNGLITECPGHGEKPGTKMLICDRLKPGNSRTLVCMVLVKFFV